MTAEASTAKGARQRVDTRRSGRGGRLPERAEEVAHERGCRQVLVSSCTFQAPPLYRRHRYVEFARSPLRVRLPVEGADDVHFLKMLAV